jgi:hypothetical protein
MKDIPTNPLVRSARREALLVAVIFVAALAYTVTYCVSFGYERNVDSLKFVLGFPDWVFWGILVPWGVCTVFACYFSYVFMQDHDLEAETEAAASELEEAGNE